MPTQPNVKSFTAADTDGKSVRFTVSTDIVDYMHSARTFGLADLADVNAHGRFQRRVVAIPDRAAEATAPMVLTIGSDNVLHLVRRDTGAAGTGWKLIDLQKSFPASAGAGARVRAMGAAWTGDDRITVAVAVDDGTADAPSRLLVAYDLTSRSTDWEKIAWTDCGTKEKLRVEGVRVLDNGDRSWTIVLDCDVVRFDTLYLLRSTGPQSFERAFAFSTAVTYQEIHDFQAMVGPYGRSGVAVVGRSGRTTELSFRYFPRDWRRPGVTTVLPLPCPAGASVLAVDQNRDGGHDLYVGGQGVHVIPAVEIKNQDDAKIIQVMAPAAAEDVQQLEVAEGPDGAVAVVARKRNGDLVVGGAPAGGIGPTSFTTPLRLRPDVAEFAPVHGDDHAVTSLLVTYSDGRASFLLKDAQTRTWQERPLLVANSNEVTPVSCYGTSLRFMGSGGLPRADVEVSVSASALTSVTLNGRTVFIGPNLAATTTTDGNGAVHLYDRVRSLTPPVYRFQMTAFGETIDVNPSGGIQERLSKITAEELRGATVANGKDGATPLLPAEFRTGARQNEVAPMVAALNHAAALASDTTGGVLPGVRTAKNGALYSSRLIAASTRMDTFAIEAGAYGVRPADPARAAAIAAHAPGGGDFFADLGTTLADFFEGLWDRVEQGWTFIVRKAEEAFEFICALGDKIKRFVLNTLEEIGSFFTWLWDQVKIGLEKLWDYLKFVFDWGDILRARDAMVVATDEALKYLKSNTGTLKTQTAAGFRNAIGAVNQWRGELGVPPARLIPPAPGESFAERFNQAGSAAHDLLDQASGNSVIGWVIERVSGIMDEIVHVEGPNPASLALGAAENFVLGLAGGELDVLMKTWEQLQADIAKIVGDAMPDAEALSFDTVRKIFIAVGADAVIGLLEGVEVLVMRALDLLADMIDVVRAFLFAKISFPFIEKLVALVAPDVHIDTSFRFVDALMLLVAIPATIAYKVIFNEAPFKPGEALQLPFGRVTVQAEQSIFSGFGPYAALAGAFFKYLKGAYSTFNAFKGDFTTGWVSVVGGIGFGAVGLVGMVLARREQDGDAVTGLEWTAIAAAGLALAVSTALSVARIKNPIPGGAGAIPSSHRIDAGVDLVATATQAAMGMAVFGVIIDRLRQSSRHYDQVRQLPESFGWVSALLDQAGTVLTDIATMLPLAGVKAKAVLVAISTAGKGGALVCKIVEVVTTKLVLEPAGPPR